VELEGSNVKIKTLPIKLWIPMWLAKPPVGVEFWVREKRTFKGRGLGVRNAGDEYVTLFGLNMWNEEVHSWRYRLPSEV
jgi:hypothetical protein